jgi:hypothetical protein
MQVEVTPENIVAFNLTELTGNSAEVLMQRAKEAAETGMVLAVTIPDDKIDFNVFQHGINPSGADERMQPDRGAAFGEEKSPYSWGADTKLNVVDVVQGEVIDSHVEED